MRALGRIVPLAGVVLMLASATANAKDIPSTVVSDSAVPAHDSDHVTGRLDTVTTAWVSGSGDGAAIQFRRTLADGSSSLITTIPGAGSDPHDLDLELMFNDVVSAVWNSGQGIKTTRIAADGTPGPVITLGASSTHTAPQQVTDNQDRTTVVWTVPTSGNQRIVSLRIGADGTPGPIRSVSKVPARSFAIATVGYNNVEIAWTTDTRREVQLRTIYASGKPGRIHTLSPRGQQASDPVLAVNSDEATVVAWSTRSHRDIQGTMIRKGAAPSPSRTLSNPESQLRVFDPVVAFGRSGTASVVWENKRGGTGIIAAQLTKDGTAVPPRKISSDRTDPRITHLQGGDVLLTMVQPEWIDTKTFSHGKWSSEKVVADSRGAANLRLDAVGKDGTLTWESSKGGPRAVHLARVPAR